MDAPSTFALSGTIRTAEGFVRLGLIKPSTNLKREVRDFSREDSLVQGLRSKTNRYAIAVGEGRAFATLGAVTFENHDFVDSASAAWTHWYDARTDEIGARWTGAAIVDANYRHRQLEYAEEITTGNVYIGGRKVNDVQPKDRDIAMGFQNYALYPHMTVYNNMAFGLKLRKYARDEIERRQIQGGKRGFRFG